MGYDRDMLVRCSLCNKEHPSPDDRCWGMCQECWLKEQKNVPTGF